MRACILGCLVVSGWNFPRTRATAFPPYPDGPYILLGSDERVRLPVAPEIPILFNQSSVRTNCPHHQLDGLKHWHDATTWGGTGVPVTGNVTIPPGMRILLSQSITAKLDTIFIPADSELVFGENSSGIVIHCDGLDVRGRLTAGSETCRIETPLTITLHGARPAHAGTHVPPPVVKGISVQGGWLSFHGKRYFSTWTRLARRAVAGETVLLLQRPVNWESGQQVLVVTSSIKDSRDYNKNEVVTIRAVHTSPPPGVGAVVYLTQPLQFNHSANDNYQVEVALLSRTIKIQGHAFDSEPSDPDMGGCLDDRANQNWHIWHQTTMPCLNKGLTGYGGHIMIHDGGIGQLEGVELFRMGQTNVMGRYPLHFHVLQDCPSCYLKDSSIHHSFYRCVSIHGTNRTTISENVAYDITGFCYYLEDGVEMENTISYNLAAHIHPLHDMPWSFGQQTSPNVYRQSPDLALPADVSASGFYITNTYNTIVGNAASGGYSGFSFPNLAAPVGLHRHVNIRPSSVPSLLIDGNSAHSTGWWWHHAGGFYIGGALYFNEDNQLLEYIPGRSMNFARDGRSVCSQNMCETSPGGNCQQPCPNEHTGWLRISNTKIFLVAGIGLNSWAGRVEVHGLECHDCRLSMQALSQGFFANDVLAVCRTGESLDMQVPRANRLEGTGFVWYDTSQEHILVRATFRNCGIRNELYNQYDSSLSRGCADHGPANTGCSGSSTVFGFLSHSDLFNPEVMQATQQISFENCGRRFRYQFSEAERVSGRLQNWIDVDGSATGLNESSFIVSGLESAHDWWNIEDSVVTDSQGPLKFIRKSNGPSRALAHIRLAWDDDLHNSVGKTICGNTEGYPCEPVGYVRHLGHKFSPMQNSNLSRGLPVTANPDIVGITGGYGWLLDLNIPAPRQLTFSTVEVDPDSPLIVSIPYPMGTNFAISAHGAPWCSEGSGYTCSHLYTKASSIDEVRKERGDSYHVDETGVLSLRIVMMSDQYIGNARTPFQVPHWSTPGKWNQNFALRRFERDEIRLPMFSSAEIRVQARCPSDIATSPKNGYCPEVIHNVYDPDVCPVGYVQVSYDKCCAFSDRNNCVFAGGNQDHGVQPPSVTILPLSPKCCDMGWSGFKAFNECKEFYRCVHGVVSSNHTCPSGMLFDARTQNCNWEANVVICNVDNCNGTTVLSTALPTEAKEPSISPTLPSKTYVPTTNPTQVPSVRPAVAQCCPNGMTGFRPWGDCSAYYRCVFGRVFSQHTCREGLKFDPRTQNCNWAWAVPNCVVPSC